MTRRVIQPSPSAGAAAGAAAEEEPLMEPEEEAPPAPLPDILPETEPEAAPPSPGTPLIEPDMEPDMLPEPDVTDEELGAMEELDEGLEDELPELPQQPANLSLIHISEPTRH